MKIPIRSLLLSDPFHDATFVEELVETDKIVRSINIIDNPYGFQFVEKDSLLIIGGQDWFLKKTARGNIFRCITENQVACIVLYNYDESVPFYRETSRAATEAGIPILLMGDSGRLLTYGKILEYFSEHYYIADKNGFLQKGYIQKQMYNCAEQDKVGCIAKRLWLYTNKEVYARIDDTVYHYGSKTDIEAIMADADRWVSTSGFKAEKFVNGSCYYYGPEEVFFSIYSFDKTLDGDLVMVISREQKLDDQELSIFQYAQWAIQADIKRNSLEFTKQQSEKLMQLLGAQDDSCNDAATHGKGIWGDQVSRVLLLNATINPENMQLIHQELYRMLQKSSQPEGELIFGEYEEQLVLLIPDSFMPKVKGRDFKNLLQRYSPEGKKFRMGQGDAANRIDLRESYLQAKKALFWANLQKRKYSISYDELGFLALLDEKNILNRVQTYNRRYLEKLTAYDQKNGTELFHTLSIYITSLWNFSSASKLLFVHLNTVKYRIEQAEKIMGIDLSDSDVRTNLEVAVKITEFFSDPV
jgi:hypothetical protein